MPNSVSIANLRSKVWDKKLFKDVYANLYFMQNGMMGNDDNTIIQYKDDLMKGPGDSIKFGLTARLSMSTGVTGDNELKGNESAITPYDMSVSIDQYRDAVRLNGILDEQINAYDMRTDAKNKLKEKLTAWIEQQIFLKLGGVTNTSITDVSGDVVGTFATWSNTPAYIPDADENAGYGSRYLCACATGTDAMAATDVMTTDLIDAAVLKAKTANPKIRPLRINGKLYFLMFIHPHQAYDLKQNAVFNQARREAEQRGSENPIFTGALGIWNGVILHEHEMVPFLDVSSAGNSFRGAASGTDCAVDAYRALLCGAQAGVYARCNNPNGWVEDEDDFKNKVSFATGVIGGIQKTVFNSKEYGVIAVDTASSITV